MLGNKKGIYYTLDAILAGFLLIGVVIILLNADFETSLNEQQLHLARDLMNGLDELKIYEMDNSFLEQEINNGNITDIEQSLIELIGYYWATNQSHKSEIVFNILAENVLKDNYGVRLTINEELIFLKDINDSNDIYVTSRLISGIDEGVPLLGASSSAYLKRIKNKKSSSYAYLGGFVGQGNISFLGEPLPTNTNSSNIEMIYLEGDFAEDFYFYINEQQCQREPGQNLFSVTKENLSIDSWVLDDCKEFVQSGKNLFTIEFQGDLVDSYVSGGLVRIDYRTNELQEVKDYGFLRYDFPSITGLANLFDSFYIPGALKNIEIQLVYETNDSAYLTIGERIIELNNPEGELEPGIIGNVTENDKKMYNITLTNDFLKNQVNLDFDLISNNTVPLRFASYDLIQKVIESGDADVVLISDYSGSMMRAIDNWGMGNRRSRCENALEDSETRRTDLATCLNKEFADNILNYTGNRLWPVYMHDDEIVYYDNSEDLEAIKGYMKSFQNGRGGSCISCAINQAYEILDYHSNESREKFVILMTDGVPTHCPEDGCEEGISVIYSSNEECHGICNSPGGCSSSQIDVMCNNCIDNPGGAESLYFSSQRLRDDLNTTIFSVGFGPFENVCSFAGDVLTEVSTIGNGTYQHSQNNEELQLIYENISMEILTRIDQQNQTVNVRGVEVNSNLLKNSYIDFEFEPLIMPPAPGKISVNIEEPLTECSNTVNIYEGLEIVDAKVTSYSGSRWSDLVVSNGVTVFNLSDYYVPYPRLGDPFQIQVPVNTLNEGQNSLVLGTGSSPENKSSCSAHNKFIYTVLIPSATMRTDVKTITEGCTWTVDFEDGDQQIINVPSDYEGEEECFYQPGNVQFNENDTYAVAMYDLLTQLDTNSNGRLIVNINELDLEVTTTILENVPFLWGPVLMRLEVWV